MIKKQLILVLCCVVSAAQGAAGLPLPALISGSSRNMDGQVTGRAVRQDIQNNAGVVDQQDTVLTQTRNAISKLSSTLRSAFTAFDKKIAQLNSLKK